MPAFGLIHRMQVGDTGPAESTRRVNLQRVWSSFSGLAGQPLYVDFVLESEPAVSLMRLFMALEARHITCLFRLVRELILILHHFMAEQMPFLLVFRSGLDQVIKS